MRFDLIFLIVNKEIGYFVKKKKKKRRCKLLKFRKMWSRDDIHFHSLISPLQYNDLLSKYFLVSRNIVRYIYCIFYI